VRGLSPSAGRTLWRLAAAVWLVGAVVIWNRAFDRHVIAGARDYVDRQQLASEGRGPRVDVDQIMNAAITAGRREATRWTLAELIPGGALLLFARHRLRSRAPVAAPKP